MANKGFLIQDLLDPLGVTLNMPPKRDSNRQLSRQEVEETRRIAEVRIHVERKMEQIKNFRILQGVIPACLLYTSPSPRDQRGSRMPSSA